MGLINLNPSLDIIPKIYLKLLQLVLQNLQLSIFILDKISQLHKFQLFIIINRIFIIFNIYINLLNSLKIITHLFT